MEGQSEAKTLKSWKKLEYIKPLVEGKTFGRTMVISYSHSEELRHYFLCKCLNCGNESPRRVDSIRRDNPIYCLKCKHETYRKGSTETVYNKLYGMYKVNAKNRGVCFNLSISEFKEIIHLNCYYCGEQPYESGNSKKSNRTNTIIKHNGIDRINSKLGYEKGNVLPCCPVCNLMKNKFSKDVFLEKISRIYDNLLK